MLLRTLGAFTACIAGTSAFKDTSPYLLFSTSDSTSAVLSRQLQSATDAFEDTKGFLSGCPSDIYVIVSQPNANAADYTSSKAIPHLRRAMSSASVKTKLSVSEVVGEINAQEIEDFITHKCGAVVENFVTTAAGFSGIQKSSKPLVIRIDFDSLPKTSTERAIKLADNDSLLHMIFDILPTTKYTLMYTTTPVTGKIVHNTPSYDPVFPAAYHMELKRQTNVNSTSTKDTDAERRKMSLFDRYQFFTPGLFMALIVSFILLSILSVGIAALGSLQVSYGAFEKEMGPAAQKKVQ